MGSPFGEFDMAKKKESVDAVEPVQSEKPAADKKPEMSKETLEAELAGLQDKAHEAMAQAERAQRVFQQHIGAIEALKSLIATYYPA